jgi:branched-chain amino acid transport system substrate-binding protein
MAAGRIWTAGLFLAALALPAAALAASADKAPIKIGVISEQAAIVGKPILWGAELAAHDINAKGGVNGHPIEIIAYDDHSSAADAVRAFQRAAQQDHVKAVVTTFISEIALAIEPWAARLHMPTITPVAASNLISKQVHDNYDRFKYMFEGWLASPMLATVTCDASHDLLVDMLHMKTAAIVSEDADWTKPLDKGYEACLPKAGLRVVDHVRFNPDTTDFTPIYNSIEAKHPDVIIAGWAHVGVQPTVQWHDQHVPIALAGVNAQASNPSFWKSTNGATNGVITETGTVEGVPLTPLTIPVGKEFVKRFGQFPAFSGFTAYDAVRALAGAMERAKSTDPDKIVAAMEETDMTGTLGPHYEFYGRNDIYTHALKYGKGYTTGIFMQWQGDKQVCIWPRSTCPAKLVFPSFVTIHQASAK